MDHRVLHIKNKTFEVFASSVIGIDKIENQDYYMIYSDDNCIILTLADGLGSATFSREGAKTICKIGVELLKGTTDELLWNDLLVEWKNAIKHNYNLYDTTFKYIKITFDSVEIGGVGDGWLALLKDGDVISKEIPHTFSNQTDSILSTNLSSAFFKEDYENYDELFGIIATDGFSEDLEKINIKQMLIDFANAIDKDGELFEKEIDDTLTNWPNVNNCDDKTVIMIRRIK